MPDERRSRSMVCACDITLSTVSVACVPVSLPFILKTSSAFSQGACSGPADLLAFETAAKNTSSIFSTLASASFIGFSPSDTPLAHELLERLAVGLDGLQQRAIDAGSALPSIASTSTPPPDCGRCPSKPPRSRS